MGSFSGNVCSTCTGSFVSSAELLLGDEMSQPTRELSSDAMASLCSSMAFVTITRRIDRVELLVELSMVGAVLALEGLEAGSGNNSFGAM